MLDKMDRLNLVGIVRIEWQFSAISDNIGFPIGIAIHPTGPMLIAASQMESHTDPK